MKLNFWKEKLKTYRKEEQEIAGEEKKIEKLAKRDVALARKELEKSLERREEKDDWF